MFSSGRQPQMCQARHRPWASALVFLALGVAGCDGSSDSGAPMVGATKGLKVTLPENPQEVSWRASELLGSVEAARGALARGDARFARRALFNARSYTNRLAARMRAPIYAENSSVAIVDAIEAARREAGKPVPERNPSIDGGFTRIVLFPASTREGLAAAEAALAANKPRLADAELRGVQARVLLDLNPRDVALVQGRQAVARALAAKRRGDLVTMAAELEEARRLVALPFRMGDGDAQRPSARADDSTGPTPSEGDLEAAWMGLAQRLELRRGGRLEAPT